MILPLSGFIFWLFAWALAKSTGEDGDGCQSINVDKAVAAVEKILGDK